MSHVREQVPEQVTRSSSMRLALFGRESTSLPIRTSRLDTLDVPTAFDTRFPSFDANCKTANSRGPTAPAHDGYAVPVFTRARTIVSKGPFSVPFAARGWLGWGVELGASEF